MFGFGKSKQRKELLETAEQLKMELAIATGEKASWETIFIICGAQYGGVLAVKMPSLEKILYEAVPESARKNALTKISRLLSLKIVYMHLARENSEIGNLPLSAMMRESQPWIDGLIRLFWADERNKGLAEFSLLQQLFHTDPYNEARLIYAKIHAICRGRDLDLTSFSLPVDTVDLVNIPSIPVNERPTFSQIESVVFDGFLEMIGVRN